MFYAKASVGGELVSVALTDRNVFTFCPKCRKEVYVNILKVSQSKNDGLYKTEIFCNDWRLKEGETE